MDEEAVEVKRRPPVKRRIALGLLGLILVALLIAWIERRPIAEGFIERELERRGVQATYRVERIGLRTQRIEDLVIGDPRRPDLTARWVELRLSWGFRRPKVTLITARGIRLNARLVNGRISLGEVDKLLPPPSGLPFRFPDQPVDIADASIRLDTPNGRVGVAVAGRGNLGDGFRGRMAARSGRLRLGDCRISRAAGLWSVAIDDLKPSFKGPLGAESLACGDFLLNRPQMALEATLAEGLDSWRGKSGLRSDGARMGKDLFPGLGGAVTFDGNSRLTRGKLDLASAGARVAGFTVTRAGIEGRYAVSLASGKLSLLGDAVAQGMAAGPETLAPLTGALDAAGGTPVEPIGEALAAALARAGRGFDAAGSIRLVSGPGYGGVRISGVTAVSRSGARLSVAGGDGFNLYWPGGGTRIDGDFALGGGGFPQIRLSLRQEGVGAPISGVGRIAPMTAGGARLAFGVIRFTAAAGGETRIDTLATLDGPIPDGRVEGLVLPISGRVDGRGGFVFGEGCVASRFRLLRVGTLALGPTPLPLCPTGRALIWKAPGGTVRGGAELRNPRFAGRLGETPLSLASSRLRFGLDGPNFTSSDLAVRLGRAEAINWLNVGTLSGRFGGKGAAGRYAGLSAKLAAVPLNLDRGEGSWTVRNGALSLEGALRISDQMEPPRFYPLVSNDFRLALADNRIEAGGWMIDPETGTRIARSDVAHDLNTGRGRALLQVPGIAFGPDYQPEQLTSLTTGVVALVNGVLKGEAEIGWDGRGTSSSGTFSTEDMDLAATFGPVEGLSTTLHFTDLLGLVSAPGEVAETDLIRTGIDVVDGRIRYQLLPGLRVKVEGGRWPFAGGELFLEETILDFSKPTAKQLTFRVVGLDAARFIQQMEFSNISATGTFDGIIPMVFDERGGRIVGGSLVARPEGGTLSYIGELSDKQLGVYGKLAFEALKSLRYNKLTIGLDGSLEGEFVAAIELDGVARDPVLTSAPSGGISGLVAGRALKQLAKIPFEFNIGVKGPFRALLATMRSFEDPTNLIQSVLPEKLRAPPAIPTAPPETVQPKESEIVR